MAALLFFCIFVVLSVDQLQWLLIVRFFPAAGFRYIDGKSNHRARTGVYWSFFANSLTAAWNLDFSDSGALLGIHTRAIGYSIRCVARAEDTTAVSIVLCIFKSSFR